jgi:hypothetical protein
MEAKPEPIRPAPDGEIRAAAGTWGRGDCLSNRRFGKTTARQSGAQPLLLPGCLGCGRPMLQGAAAAAFQKMRASGRDAIRAWRDDVAYDRTVTIAALATDIDMKPFARKPQRDIKRAGGDTIAARTHPLNQDFHGRNFG